jgi:phytoene synthase
MNTQLLSDLPPPQRIALAYAPARARPATLALLALDARMAAILRGRREPLAAQLRLAWWREMFALPTADWPGGEPLLESLRGWRDPAGLAALADGWEALLADELTPAVIDEFAAGRIQGFACLAGELGLEAEGNIANAARVWALADLAANVSVVDECRQVVALGRDLAVAPLPKELRALAVLAGLGRAALDKNGAPLLSGAGSMLRALRIGLTGR